MTGDDGDDDVKKEGYLTAHLTPLMRRTKTEKYGSKST